MEKKTGDWSSGEGFLPGRETLGPLALMFLTPLVSIIFFHVCAHMNGDFIAFAGLCYEMGFWTVMFSIWPNPLDAEVWQMILSFMAFELALMKLVPGKRFEGSLTPKGNTPVYTANGMACYLITLSTLLLLGYLDIFDPARVYDKFGNILSSMNVFAWVFCFMLLVKGYVAPSSTDSGTTGNIVHDFFWVRCCGSRRLVDWRYQTASASHVCQVYHTYWVVVFFLINVQGMELYPRIFGWDVKMFTNCRTVRFLWGIGGLRPVLRPYVRADHQRQPWNACIFNRA